MKVEIPENFPAHYLEQFLKTVEETRNNGYGRIVLEVTVQQGSITLVAISKNETFKLLL